MDLLAEMHAADADVSLDEPFCYSHDRALFAALCASAAYQSEAEAKRSFEAAGFEEVRLVERQSTQAYVAVVKSKGPIAVIAFRGTDSLDDMIADLKFLCRSVVGHRGLRAHRGFDSTLDGIWDDLVRVLQEIKHTYGPLELHLMGHSLGGALALLAALRLTDIAVGTVVDVVTIGCPRVGNRKLAVAISACAPVHRIVHAADIVPRIPPLLFLYRHVGMEYWLLPGGEELTTGATAGELGFKVRLARATRWVQKAYERGYAYRQYILVSVIGALLATFATYKGLGIELSVLQALTLSAVYFLVLHFVVSDLGPTLFPGLGRYVRSHAITDHGSKLYVGELARRAGRNPRFAGEHSVRLSAV